MRARALFGHSTSLAVGSGESVTEIVPVIEGKIVTDAVMAAPLNEVLAKKLKHQGIIVELETARDIKEKYCAVSAKLKKEDGGSYDYTLPDGTRIHIGMERFEDAEVFDPKLLNPSVDGIHKMIRTSLNKFEDDDRKVMTNSIFLSGGNTMFNGIETRLQAELSRLGIEAKIKAHA
ncbi:hypothetical protein BGZ82_009608 [Podila clonocystis]|nr:hypothetical protein BGZ82_009608 [Podila clonocystis]